jgi:hypothetical protein
MTEVAMMKTLAVFGIATIVLVGTPVWADAQRNVLDAGGQFTWRKAGSHPKKAELVTAILNRKSLSKRDDYQFCLVYGRSPRTGGGKVIAIASRVDGAGVTAEVARVRSKVSNGFLFTCTPPTVVDFKKGDLVVWKLLFQKMDRFQAGTAAMFDARLISNSPPFD